MQIDTVIDEIVDALEDTLDETYNKLSNSQKIVVAEVFYDKLTFKENGTLKTPLLTLASSKSFIKIINNERTQRGRPLSWPFLCGKIGAVPGT